MSSNQDGSSHGVFGQRYAATGMQVGTEFRVNTYTTGAQYGPSVATNSSGDFLVVWQSNDQDGFSGGIFGQRFASTGAPLSSEFRVNTETFLGQRSPRVASGADGVFVVVWNSYQDASGYGVFGRRYSSTGATLGAEFRLNTWTTDRQDVPAVSTGQSGDFVVVWRSYNQDGSAEGVFGQICPSLSSVTIAAMGSTTVCTTSTAGTASVVADGGGSSLYQWGYRTSPGSPTIVPIGQTGTSYTIDGSHFVGPGTYFLVTFTSHCWSFVVSNEIAVTVISDATPPAVTPSPTLTTTQTLCM
jgi:hypothetical protein